MRTVSFITIFLSLGLCNANGTTLYCNSANLYIYKNGPTIEVASKPDPGFEIKALGAKLADIKGDLIKKEAGL